VAGKRIEHSLRESVVGGTTVGTEGEGEGRRKAGRARGWGGRWPAVKKGHLRAISGGGRKVGEKGIRESRHGV
jgi:hypothetical protein